MLVARKRKAAGAALDPCGASIWHRAAAAASCQPPAAPEPLPSEGAVPRRATSSRPHCAGLRCTAGGGKGRGRQIMPRREFDSQRKAAANATSELHSTPSLGLSH